MADPVVEVTTSLGSFVIQLDPARAPKSVENFLAYVDAKHYDNTIFHRIIPTFNAEASGTTTDDIIREVDESLRGKASKPALTRSGA